jgi:hypothetical protein
LALLAAHYGHQIIFFIHVHGHPAVLSIVGVVAAVVVIFLVWRYGKKDKSAGSRKRQAIKSKA